MKLKQNEELILMTLNKEAGKGVAGYVNLAKKVASKISIEEIRHTLVELEEKGFVRYMRTQDRSLLLGQITDAGLREAATRKITPYRTLFVKRFKDAFAQIKKHNLTAVVALAIIVISMGSYYLVGGDSFQASLFEVENATPEKAIQAYGEQKLNFAEVNFEISFAGQLGENYFYQVDTSEGHWLLTLNKANEIVDVENLHR